MIFFELKQRQIQTLGVSGKSLEMARTGHRCVPVILSTEMSLTWLLFYIVLEKFIRYNKLTWFKNNIPYIQMLMWGKCTN